MDNNYYTLCKVAHLLAYVFSNGKEDRSCWTILPYGKCKAVRITVEKLDSDTAVSEPT